MTTFTSRSLNKLMQEIFLCVGCSEEEASIASEHLIESSLLGIDSHGVKNSISYARTLENKIIHTGQQLELIHGNGASAVYEGNLGFGIVLGLKAAEKAIGLAREHGVGIVGVRHISHTGRLGTYPTFAANKEMLAVAMANAPCKEGMRVAPYGGTRGRLATNPMAWAFPRANGFPFLLDMATSVVAAGKVRVHRDKGQAVPEGWLVDLEGNVVTDPNRFFDTEDVALLPFGGHKGFGLSLLVDMLAGALIGHEVMYEPVKETLAEVGQGLFLLVIDIKKFLSVERFEEEAERLFSHIKRTPLKPGVNEILVPGELEQRVRVKRLREGIPVDERTWQDIVAFSEKHGVDAKKIAREAL